MEYFLSVCDAFPHYISYEDFTSIFTAVFPCEQTRPWKKYSWFTSPMSNYFYELQRTQYELENVDRDDIMKVIRKSSFHLFRDFTPLTLPFLLSRRFPFAFTFLRVLLWVWRLKYITKTTQSRGNIKPWPNGDASWRKLKTWVNLRLRLARACVHLGWLHDDLRSLWSRSNLHASRRKFFTVWPPNPSQRKFINVY